LVRRLLGPTHPSFAQSPPPRHQGRVELLNQAAMLAPWPRRAT
jgi:hypothetical protein